MKTSASSTDLQRIKDFEKTREVLGQLKEYVQKEDLTPDQRIRLICNTGGLSAISLKLLTEAAAKGICPVCLALECVKRSHDKLRRKAIKQLMRHRWIFCEDNAGRLEYFISQASDERILVRFDAFGGNDDLFYIRIRRYREQVKHQIIEHLRSFTRKSLPRIDFMSRINK